VRFNVWFDFDLGDIPLNYNLDQSNYLIAKPGNPIIFDQPNILSSIDSRHDLENLLKHKFKFFSVHIKQPINLEVIGKIASEMY